MNIYYDNVYLSTLMSFNDDYINAVNDIPNFRADFETVQKVITIVVAPFTLLALSFAALIKYAFDSYLQSKEITQEIPLQPSQKINSVSEPIQNLSTSENVQPMEEAPIWEINEQKMPNKIEDAIKALYFLEENPEWVELNPDQSKSYFLLLEKTNFSGLLSKREWDVYANLFVKHRILFPVEDQEIDRVLLKTNNPVLEIQISKNRLLALSNKFSMLLKNKSKENVTNIIELNTSGYDQYEGAVQAVIEFIKNGEINLTGENIDSILKFAHEHSIDVLVKKCEDFISDNLTLELLPDTIEIGLELHLPELIWRCLLYGFQSGVHQELRNESLYNKFEGSKVLKELNLEKCSWQTKNLIKELIELPSYGLKLMERPGEIEMTRLPDKLFSLKNFGKIFDVGLEIKQTLISDLSILHEICPSLKKLIIDCPFNIEEDGNRLKQFKKLVEFRNESAFLTFQDIEAYLAKVSPIEVTGLNLMEMKEEITDENLKKLAEKLPNLKCLHIENAKITTIPFQHLEELICGNCPELKTIDGSKLISLCCEDCSAITKIFAPKVTKMECCNCPLLEKMVVPKVIDLDVHATLLKDISAPLATKIRCTNNSELTYIFAPLATFLECHFNPLLLKIDAPIVRNLDCSQCIALKEIYAPKAAKINCFNCSALTTLFSPKVFSLSWLGCDSLTKVNIPKSKYLDSTRVIYG